MKKLILSFVALMALCACGSGEREYYDYRGLSMGLPYKTFTDSLAARGFSVDSMRSTDKTVVMTNPAERYYLILAQRNDTLFTVQETYRASKNDSTRQLWQQTRDQLEKDLGRWPNAPMLKDDHKICVFETDKGTITVILENTYTPTMSVVYDIRKKKAK